MIHQKKLISRDHKNLLTSSPLHFIIISISIFDLMYIIKDFALKILPSDIYLSPTCTAITDIRDLLRQLGEQSGDTEWTEKSYFFHKSSNNLWNQKTTITEISTNSVVGYAVDQKWYCKHFCASSILDSNHSKVPPVIV